MTPETDTSEEMVRTMRDRVYGIPSSDNNWKGCREKWLEPENIQWLREHQLDNLP